MHPYSAEDLEYLRTQGIDDPEDDPSVAIVAPDQGPRIWFNRVPEGKVVKNRVHIDINLERVDQIEWLVGLGARILRPLGVVADEPWAIMADPEGNEFCAFPPRS